MKKVELDELVSVGAQMANVCFNLSQRKSLDESLRESMRDLYVRWDAARKKITMGQTERGRKRA